MIFLDTSALYALADAADLSHREAKRQFDSLLHEEEELVTHNYILVECAALMQRRLGLRSAVQFLHDAVAFRVVWVESDLHEAALKRFSKPHNNASFVDCVSFALMERENITAAFAFDQDFKAAGFTPYAPPR